VKEWVDAGQVDTSSPTLKTDSAGQLRVTGLPRGDYLWSLTTPGSQPAEGIATVLPGVARRVSILLP